MNSTTVTTVASASTTSTITSSSSSSSPPPVAGAATTPAVTSVANAANNSTTNVSNQSRTSINQTNQSTHNSDQSGNISSSSNQVQPQQKSTQASVTSPAPTTNINNGNKSKHQQAVTSNESLTDSIASTEGHRTPNLDLLSKTNLYIRGLQANTNDQDLYKMCSRFGSISSTKAILDKTTGCCRGYGFVEFTSAQSAEFAVQELTKSGIQAQMAKISPLYSSHHHHHHNHHHHNNNNHHHNHNPHHHNNNGTPTTNSNNSNPNNSASGGGASSSGGGGGVGGGGSSSGGSSSINNTSNNSINTNTHLNPASNQQHYQSSPNNNNADPTNLYIANLPPNMSEIELENLLSSYGPVVSTRILRDQSNIPRGVGFARMESRDKCEQIIEQLNGRPCKGWSEPLLVKFADGGTKKRNHHNNHHQHQHHNTNHHQPHKSHQEETRWRESSNASDLDLAMMNPMSYPRIQPGFPQPVAPGSAYPPHLGAPTSAPQWIHHGGPGQPYVISQQMIQAAGLGPSNQVAAAAAALHYGHIPQLTSQMQGLQISHPGASIGGYLPPHHQWSGLWTHPISPQPQASMRLATPVQQQAPPPPSQQLPPRQQQSQQQQSPQVSNMQHHNQHHHHHQPPTVQPQQQQPTIADTKLQISMPL